MTTSGGRGLSARAPGSLVLVEFEGGVATPAGDTGWMDAEVTIGQLRLATDVEPAAWVVGGVRDFEYDVGSLVPVGFEAYARVFHPAYRFVATEHDAGPGACRVETGRGPMWEREVRWSEVAAANGRVAHAVMEWVSITGDWRYYNNDTQPGLWDQMPTEGSFPRRQIERLISVLRKHTATADRCWFAVWDGYGNLPFEPRGIRKVQMPQRPMLLFAGPLCAAATSLADDPWEQSPSLWWPDDRAWCVATDVDLMTTYIGASRRCIDDLIASPNMEALEVTIDQDITYDADKVNPEPAGRGPFG